MYDQINKKLHWMYNDLVKLLQYNKFLFQTKNDPFQSITKNSEI